MAEFQELIKNFDRIRDYMRQFYVYGFKVRGDYDVKSARTYDNEKRRIESWLSEYMVSEYTSKGKQVYINVDSRTIRQNPLYAAWKAKSFTGNDIMLHFFIPAQLYEKREGLLGTVKKGKTLLYHLKPGLQEDSFLPLLTAVKFYQEGAPFGFIGSTILDRENSENDRFQFKHHFIVHTLEDGILFEILEAMREHRRIEFVNKSSRSGNESSMKGLPLKIFVSTRTGRRYICCYLENRRRFMNFRLDCISKVKMTSVCEDYAQWKAALQKNLGLCWGVSFGGTGRGEEISVKFYIDVEKESYILKRIYREGRGALVRKTGEHEYLYTGTFFDTNEMLSWLKTFTGRILDIQCRNRAVVAKVKRDLERMYEMYCGDEKDGVI